jgi:nicotinamide-nucleotide amidase
MQENAIYIIMPYIVDNITETIAGGLRERCLTLGTVESASGGLISHLITNIPGSSDFFKGSVVSYSNAVKSGLVGVRIESLQKHGAVSAVVAEEMASEGRRLLDVDICLSDTGIAGPGGQTAEKPVGLFYLGFSCKDGTYSRMFLFEGSRIANKESAAKAALNWLSDFLTGNWQPGLS